MRNRLASWVLFLVVFASPAAAQVYYPTTGLRIPPSDEQKKAAEESKRTIKYDPHDLSGIWSPEQYKLMGGIPAPPMTASGQQLFDARKPSTNAPASRTVAPGLGNDPLGACDPLGYPRNILRGSVEFLQTPRQIVQIFLMGMRVREIYTDGRTLPADLDPRWYGWAVGHWDGDALAVDSTGYDERAWLDDNGLPHSEDMKLHEVYRHPDALTLDITMSLDDPKTFTKPWVGIKQSYTLELPKGLTVLYEWYCVPSEEESFNQGIRNPASGIVSK